MHRDDVVSEGCMTEEKTRAWGEDGSHCGCIGLALNNTSMSFKLILAGVTPCLFRLLNNLKAMEKHLVTSYPNRVSSGFETHHSSEDARNFIIFNQQKLEKLPKKVYYNSDELLSDK